MIELVLVYCLANDPIRCLDQREVREAVASPIACAMMAQTYAQDYLDGHPRLRLQGWRCEVDRPKESPA